MMTPVRPDLREALPRYHHLYRVAPHNAAHHRRTP